VQGIQTLNKQQLKWLKKFEARLRQTESDERVPELRRTLSAAAPDSRRSPIQTSLPGGGILSFEGQQGDPSLDPEGFANFLLGLLSGNSAEEFDHFLAVVAHAVEDAASKTQGSKREIWEMFQLLDLNHDGFVDLEELELLWAAESKRDKKHMLKWKHKVSYAAVQQMIAQGKISEELARQQLAQIQSAMDSELDQKPATILYKMSLAEFHYFVTDMSDGNTERLKELVGSLRSHVSEKQVRYLQNNRVHEIINDIIEDLLRERPKDVLKCILNSVARLQRLRKYEPFSKSPSAARLNTTPNYDSASIVFPLAAGK